MLHQCRIDSIIIGNNVYKEMDSPGNRYYLRATLPDVIQLDKDLSSLIYICCQQTPVLAVVQWAPNNLDPILDALDQKCAPKKFDILDVD